MTLARFAVLAVTLLTSLPALSWDPIPGPPPWDGGDLEAEDLAISSGWDYAQATGDLSKLKLALRPHCLSHDWGVRHQVEGYLRNGGRQMTREQRQGLLEYCFALEPNSDPTSWLFQMAKERFEAWPSADRENAYWEAVATGHNCVEGSYEFSRLDAVLLGAWARYEGFGALAEACSAEVDERSAHSDGPLPYSQTLSWTLYLWTGAPDDPAVQRLFAQRLASLEPSFSSG